MHRESAVTGRATDQIYAPCACNPGSPEVRNGNRRTEASRVWSCQWPVRSSRARRDGRPHICTQGQLPHYTHRHRHPKQNNATELQGDAISPNARLTAHTSHLPLTDSPLRHHRDPSL